MRWSTVSHVEAPTAELASLGDDDATCTAVGHHDLCGDGMRLVLDAMNAGVSMSIAPLSGIIQLNVPLGPASADAPLSPLMKMMSVSSRIWKPKSSQHF